MWKEQILPKTPVLQMIFMSQPMGTKPSSIIASIGGHLLEKMKEGRKEDSPHNTMKTFQEVKLQAYISNHWRSIGKAYLSPWCGVRGAHNVNVISEQCYPAHMYR